MAANFLFKTSQLLYGTISDVIGTQESGFGQGHPPEDGAPDLENAPKKTESLVWQRVSHDVWEKIILAAFTETGGADGALEATLKNDRGSPSGWLWLGTPAPSSKRT